MAQIKEFGCRVLDGVTELSGTGTAASHSNTPWSNVVQCYGQPIAGLGSHYVDWAGDRIELGPLQWWIGKGVFRRNEIGKTVDGLHVKIIAASS